MFVIQTENGQVIMDMGRAIIDAIDFEKWFHPDTSLAYRLQESTTPILTNEIPVGSIEWTEAVSGIHLKPDNLPSVLCNQNFAPRGGVFVLNKEDLISRLQQGLPTFIKSATKMKAWEARVVSEKDLIHLPEDKLYFCSAPVEFTEEWRVFVFHDNIVDVRRYICDWDNELTEQEILTIKNWVKEAHLPYPAYTMDVGRTKSGTFEVIEIHQFISCGLYGFSELSTIWKMASQAWKYARKEAQG